ncbi:hypothetical protein [Mycolicibacterium conceptionense]|uniref:hypothetical protein n=1 Tax=Mycolicibacterium conceptionense TaxID=451644 RepID=UPI0005BC65E0|nr:hypothetical protein [Mycolicibacterium conceptionense]
MNATVDALLNAYSRPAPEATRVAAAISRAMVTEDGTEIASDAVLSARVRAAVETANHEIAAEKMPRTSTSPEHRATEFGDPVGEFTVDDADPAPVPTLRSDRRYLLTDDPAGAITESPAPEAPPWRTDPPLDGVELRTVAPSTETETARPQRLSAVDGTAHLDDDGDEQYSDSADHREYREHVDETDPAENDTEPDGLAYTGSETDDYTDEQSNEVRGGADTGPDPEPVDGDEPDPMLSLSPPVLLPPSPTDAFAGTPSPWDDQAEIAPPASGNDDDQESEDQGAVFNRDVDDPAPSWDATEPPDDMNEPTRDPETPLKERISQQLQRVREGSWRKRLLLVAGAAVTVLVLVAVFVASIAGNRGEPPQPAGQVAAPPLQSENPEPEPVDEVLVPAKVSASCGNDSDAVAPFAADKTRAWVCLRIDGLDLNVLNITFNAEVVITSICLVPGWDYVAPDGRDEWARHRLVTAVTWRMGGQAFPQEINPTRPGVCKQFPTDPPISTREMSMTITASTRPPLGKDQVSSGIGGADNPDSVENIDKTSAVGSIVINGHKRNAGS